MSGGLPTNVDPIRLADQDTRLVGSIPLRQMTRLLAHCRSDIGDVSVDLTFTRDRQRNVRTLRGQIETTIMTTCERCLGDMTLDLQGSVELLLYMPGEQVLDEQEDLLIVGESMSLVELIENELILALPIMPAHGLDQCSAEQVIAVPGSGRDESEQEQGEDSSPFAGLARLKRSDRE